MFPFQIRQRLDPIVKDLIDIIGLRMRCLVHEPVPLGLEEFRNRPGVLAKFFRRLAQDSASAGEARLIEHFGEIRFLKGPERL